MVRTRNGNGNCKNKLIKKKPLPPPESDCSDSESIGSTDTSTEYEDEDSEDEEEEEQEEVRQKVRKVMSKMYPSTYLKEKVKKDNEVKKEKENKKENKKEKENKGKRQQEEEEDEEDEDDSEYYEEYDEDDDDVDGKKINIIFGFGGGDEGEDEDEEPTDDENEEYNSDDEKTFMKETYQQISEAVTKKSKKEQKAKDKIMKKEQNEQVIKDNFEVEYADLVETKKFLAEKLRNRPESKSLLRSLDECKESIKALIKKTRVANAKDYHKLINSQKQKSENEMDYFKKKLSNKEQHKIMNDLKEINNHVNVDKPYRLALLESKIPTKYKAIVLQKLNMLRSMDTHDSEYFKLKNWVDLFMRIPFGKYSVLDVNMAHGLDACQGFMENAMKILNECAYGLNDAKMQILQMIGQWIANPSAMGTAIAIKGPMGTGKTTLVKEGISKILNRQFVLMALGGATDGSVFDGSPYVYEGSGPGMIAKKLIETKEMNSCFLFDELDKVSDTEKGQEIIGILTHLTDTTQNSEFHDKYFADVDFDMSRALFIFSYNDESRVNPILKDRMYSIQTKGYTPKEKITIATNYLLPRIREQVNFKEDEVIIPDEVLEYIINTPGLTKSEDGVRNFKRCLEIIHTKLNLFRLVKSDSNILTKEINLKVTFPITVTKKDVDALIKNDEKQSQSILAMYC
jgi:ATP-dependent Lon protease